QPRRPVHPAQLRPHLPRARPAARRARVLANVPAVRTLDALGGTGALLEIAHRFGLSRLTDTERYGLGLTIGGGEVRLLDLANAYAALGAQGRLAEPFAVRRVRDRSGAVLYARPAPATRPVLSAA